MEVRPRSCLALPTSGQRPQPRSSSSAGSRSAAPVPLVAALAAQLPKERQWANPQAEVAGVTGVAMARLIQANEHEGGLHTRVLRLLHSRRAVRRFRVVAETAEWHFVVLLVLGILARAYDGLRHRSSGSSFWLALLLTDCAAAAFAVYTARTLNDLQPPKERLPRKKWRRHASGVGFGVALGVAYLVWNMAFLLWVLIALLGRLFVFLSGLDPGAAADGSLAAGTGGRCGPIFWSDSCSTCSAC